LFPFKSTFLPGECIKISIFYALNCILYIFIPSFSQKIYFPSLKWLALFSLFPKNNVKHAFLSPARKTEKEFLFSFAILALFLLKSSFILCTIVVDLKD